MDQYIEFISNHMFLSGGLGIVSFLLVQDIAQSILRKYKLATPLFTVGLLNNDDTALLDVREPHEYVKGHIDRAINIPPAKIDERINELEPYKNQPLVVMCQTGTRSPQVCQKLYKLGFTKVYLMKGGIQGWEDLTLPVKVTKKR